MVMAGIPDQVDIDSTDGIPDNIEAQVTTYCLHI
jgi:hypothetical protein